MRKIFTTTMSLIFAAGLIICLSTTAAAQEQEMSDAEIDALIQQFLPEGVTLENAFTHQIEEAIHLAVAANPELADQIVARAVQVRPDEAETIRTASSSALKIVLAREIVQHDFSEKFREAFTPGIDDDPASPTIP
ncbi:hypothetical protein [Desulfonatronospira sp.]|uniref:hypothetical protein n=1 Tax=Desulfonatronospira sp. TaxID=1962951 RepID=UPI0025BFDE89|nr:hypothetical protein [Desulfonatronospira sp.]